jgi:glycosyltransferase involved in cell wall biosynthesis
VALSSSIALDAGPCGGAPRPPLKVIRLITGLEIGGAELGLLESLRHFDRKRFQFVVACLYNNGSVGRQIEALGVPVFDMRMRSFCDPAGLLRLWRFLKAARPDILHTHLFRANVWGRLLGGALGVPVILSSEHSMTHDDIEGHRRTPLLSAIDTGTARCCDKIIAVSEATRKYLVENSIPEEKIEVVLNSIDTVRFAAGGHGEAIRTEFGLAGAEVVTIVARLHPNKNHALLIEAFSRLHARRPQAKLLIVGSGPLEPALRAQAEVGAPGAVVFAGARGDIPAIMAASDVVVLCSEREPFGKALVEAMAAARPVIGSAVDGIPEVVVDRETGLLVPPGNCAALAEAMETLLANPEMAASMGRAGQLRAQKHFDIRKSVERFQDIYSELYAKRTAAAGKPGRAKAGAATAERSVPAAAAMGKPGLRNTGEPNTGEPLQVLCVCEPLAAGVPVYVEQLVRKLEGPRIHFTVACPAKSILRQRLAGSAVTFAEVDMHRGLNPLTESRAMLQLWKLIRGKKFDVLHLHSSKAGLLGRLLARFRKLPTVFTPHCFSFESVHDINAKFRSYLMAERKLGKATDVLACVSSYERELALRYGIVPAERIVMVPCFVDVQRWTLRGYPEGLKSKLGISANYKVVGTVSRFHVQKAPLDFARMAELVLRQRPEITFLFIGEDGPLRGEFLQYLRSRGLAERVILEPWTDDPEYLTQCVAMMDVFVLNSLWEGSPLAIIEAMAMERPVVATDIPALREMVQEAGCGLLSSPGHPERMAADVLRVLDSPELAHTLGANGRREAMTKYSLDKIAERHAELYFSLAHPRARQ